MESAFKLALEQDKPILLDYWQSSFTTSVIGVYKTDTEDIKILIKNSQNNEEYTSPIEKFYRPSNCAEFIIMTENSIYIVSSSIKKNKITNMDNFN